jgi:hypothetical protein
MAAAGQKVSSVMMRGIASWQASHFLINSVLIISLVQLAFHV